MNILFFLKPKSEVAFICIDDTVRQVMEKMEYHRYTCIPIIDHAGCYVGSISEGDLLWGIKSLGYFDFKSMEDVKIKTLKRRTDYEEIDIFADMLDLVEKAMNQNYVPVIDDHQKFIGIITRKDIIAYCYKQSIKE
jgi:FOG: CBS domain